MRKHDVRKWLHAILDLLPVILIPVFMIYSHRHTIDSGSIDVPQNQVVDFNQYIPTNQKNFDNGTDTNGRSYVQLVVQCLNDGHIVNEMYHDWSQTSPSSHCQIIMDSVLVGDGVRIKHNGLQHDIVFAEFPIAINYGSKYLLNIDFISSTPNIDNGVITTNQMFFDLTQMFGSGNEPTLTQFNEWYPNEYYDYTLSHIELLKGTSTITYQDTDIMSQAVYQLYNSVDKYFNMGNVFNMTGVYDWFNLNIFNGNAPISIYIVWNIVLYEFVMDLLFLLYGLFMWFIDMVEKIMDKPFKSIK